jgi:hypothetical protein
MNRVMNVLTIGLIVWALGTALDATAQARWITDSAALAADAAQEPIALQFRREVILGDTPQVFRVRVSADNRFVLYVNEHRIAAGPARGDLTHWRYETVDLAPYVRRGPNVIAAEVWNDAQSVPLAQISSGRTGFWLMAENPTQTRLVDTGADWRVRVDDSRTVERGMPHVRNAVGPAFYAAGPPETIDGALLKSDWQREVNNAPGWAPATPVEGSGALPWTLVADTLPQMRYERVASGRVVRASGVAATGFPNSAVTVPANSEATLLLDAGRVLAAYPAIVTSGGAGARIDVTYVEALYDPNGRSSDSEGPSRVRFADRATVKDGLALGLTDTFKPDGAAKRRMRPYWWRAWRFAEITIKTAGQPLTLEDFETWETGYPFEQRGRFVSSDPELNEVWRIGWMTGLLDAHETYMDTAYWEQLQYVGDTRIQMLLSYAIAGDARLAVQALDAYDHSRAVEGLPQAQYPGVLKQVIPPFALLWIGSLHDYWMRQPDATVLVRTLDGTRAVLDEFERYVEPTGLVGPMPGWSFVDWRPGLDGWAERGKGLRSCVITMQYVGALHEAADLERAHGDAARREKYLALANKARDGVNGECWDEGRGLYANTPAKNDFSQHATVLAVLHDIAPRERHRELLENVMARDGGIDAPAGITGPSYYFSFYLARALEHAQLLDRYFDFLEPWRAMLQRNFTTWPETPDPSRSDTHAWSAHPTSGLLEYVAGIKSDAPGFARVRVEPHLGPLTTLDAAVTHPRGMIETKYSRSGSELTASIALPEGLSGSFVWNGQTRSLDPGMNQLTLSTREAE